MSSNAIQCTAVRKTYPNFLLDDIDLAVPEGSVMGFVGPNGPANRRPCASSWVWCTRTPVR